MNKKRKGNFRRVVRYLWGYLFALIFVAWGVFPAKGGEGVSLPTSPDFARTKLLRFPDIFGENVVFTYAGDLWKAPLSGGDATRLTAHEGLELFPKFSPDGCWIAFTGQYDGDEQVYVIPSTGGMPKQLTFYPTPAPIAPRRGFDSQVMGWTPDNRVLFRSARDSNSVDCLTNLYTVGLDSGLPEKLPMPVAGAGTLSPNGKKIVYSPLFRDFRHWKRYEGGWAQYLLIYDFADGSYHPVPTTPRTDRDPMWIGDTVYFVSDRDGTLNLYRYTPDTDEPVERCTHHPQWDVRWASSDGKGRIVYELGGELVWFDPTDGTEHEIPIRVPHDGLAMRPARVTAAGQIESFELSPGGKRAIFVARGDVFTVPAEKGNTRNLTDSSDAHDRCAVWSKDGRTIATISDRSGEEQVWLLDPLGEKPPRPITSTMTARLYDLQWASAGDALSVRDMKNRLYVLLEPENSTSATDTTEAKVESGGGTEAEVSTSDAVSDAEHKTEAEGAKYEVVEVAHDPNGGDFEAAWSPDGAYLAYTLASPTSYRSIHLWDRKTRTSHAVTDRLFDHSAPAWDAKGDWLFMLGQREFAPLMSGIEWNFAGDRMDGLFAVALRKDVTNRFAPESDEAPQEGAEKPATEKTPPTAPSAPESSPTDENHAQSAEHSDKKPDEKSAMQAIDFDGIGSRIVRIPVSSENYVGLAVAGDFLFYGKSDAKFYGRPSAGKPKLMVYDLAKKKESVYLENVTAWTVSPDGKFLMVKVGEEYKIGPAAATPGEMQTVSTADLWCHRIPTAEWTEIFNEVHRRYRDYFYVPNMHGLDWEQVGEQYRQLLPFVAHRSDLTYLLTEMVAELNVGHAYLEGGDMATPPRPICGLPGATFELDRDAGRYKIAKIYTGQNEEPKYRSPLTEVGVDIAVGDYLLEIDNVPLTAADNPYRLLQNKKNAVTWRVARMASGENSRLITYKPVESESALRYLEFVLAAQKQVAEASEGRIGYLHLPNMGADGAYEFLKWYYPQRQYEGLIIDDRSNGGGNISQWVLMRLMQKMLGTRFGSTRDTATTYPGNACLAEMVCLINETSASDGDIFPHYFRKAGLGPLLGKRTWGGVVGITDTGPLTDGGIVFVPFNATNDEQGEYIIEGHGVDPDIEIWQEPILHAQGIDNQLQHGIALLLETIKNRPPRLPERPADPVKTK